MQWQILVHCFFVVVTVNYPTKILLVVKGKDIIETLEKGYLVNLYLTEAFLLNDDFDLGGIMV